MSEPDQPLAFDDLFIDFSGRRLLRGGMEQALEPKAFDVLALLAGTPGRVFTRDEILDAVWGHRHVTPGVLSRAMTLLRHALGEEAQEPRYLHTVHSVGYRFDLPVSAIPIPAAPATGPEAEPLPLPAQMRRAGDGRRAFPQWALWLLPLLALLAFAGWKLWPRTAPTTSAVVPAAPAKPTATPTLVVMPLKPIGDDESTRTIAEGLSEELIGSVAQVEGLRVIAHESTRLAAAQSDDPPLLAQKLGITHVLEGSLQQVGQSLRIHVRLLDARGDTLWARDFDRDASGVLELERDIAESIATSLTLRLGLATAPGKSGDAEFLRRFLAAQKMLYDGSQPSMKGLEPAEAEFRALLRERPDDARAHAALALALNIRASYNPNLPVSVTDESLHEATVAQRLDPTLAEPYFTRAFIACQRDQWESCMALMHEAELRGMKTPPLANLAIVLARLRYLDQAEAKARELVARDPLNGSALFTLGRVLDTIGRHDEARAYFVDSRHSPGVVQYGSWFNAYWRRDYRGAEALVEQGLAPDDPVYWPKLKPGYVATLHALTGRGNWADVEAENRSFEQDTGLFALLRIVQPDAPAHAPELIAGLEKMRKGGYSTWDLVLWNKEYAFLRHDPAFQDYLRRDGILDYWRKHGFPKQCRPQGDGAACE